jgi:hypothetical protein
VLRIANQYLRHVRTAAENSGNNVECLRGFCQISEQASSVQRRPRKAFEKVDRLIRVGRSRRTRQEVFHNVGQQLAGCRILGHRLKIRISPFWKFETKGREQRSHLLWVQAWSQQEVLDDRLCHTRILNL